MVTYAEALEDGKLVMDMMALDFMAYSNVYVVGSSFICGEGKDSDILILVPFIDSNDWQQVYVDYFESKGYKVDGNLLYGGEFVSMKNGRINILLTEYPIFFDRWVAAAHVCRYIDDLMPKGKMSRKVRVDVHQIIVDGRRLPIQDLCVLA